MYEFVISLKELTGRDGRTWEVGKLGMVLNRDLYPFVTIKFNKNGIDSLVTTTQNIRKLTNEEHNTIPLETFTVLHGYIGGYPTTSTRPVSIWKGRL